MNSNELLHKMIESHYNLYVDFSNTAFDYYQEKRKLNGLDPYNLVPYARSGAYDTAADGLYRIAELSGIPLTQRITKYRNDVQFDKDRFKDEAMETNEPEEVLETLTEIERP